MKIALIIIVSIIALSCSKKEQAVIIPFSEASYNVTLTMNWSTPGFGVPEGAHFTALTGMVHREDTFLWMLAGPASPGLEDVAEIGNNSVMNVELDNILSRKMALSKFTVPPPPPTGSVDTNLIFNSDHPCISFASMLAPSPDWFMGVSNYSLYNDGKWADEITINLSVYDAGTENGDVFAYDNTATVPPQDVALLTAANATVLANGNSSIAPIGTVRFKKN